MLQGKALGLFGLTIFFRLYKFVNNLKNCSKAHILLCGMILIAALVLRIIPVFNESLAADEPFHLNVITQSWGRVLNIVRIGMVTPPFHYLVLKTWSLAFGQNLIVLRLVSLFCSMAVVILTLILGRLIFPDERVALLAGSLVAINDLQVFSSHYLRHYAMYTLLVLILLIALWRVLQEQRSAKTWIIFTVISIILVYTHYIGWLFILSTLPTVLLTARARDFWRWLLSVAVTFLCFLPWIVTEIPIYNAKGLGPNLGWVQTPNLEAFLELFSRLNGHLSWRIGFLLSFAVACILLFAAGVGLFKAPSSLLRDLYRRAALLLSGPALLTPSILFLISINPLELPFWGYRHLIPAQAFFALLISFGVFRFSRNSRAWAALIISVLLILQLIPTLDNVLHYRLEPYNKVYAHLLKETLPRDEIFVIQGDGKILNYYAKSPHFARPFPEEQSLLGLPPSFWLVFRPANVDDSSQVKKLIDAGYSIQVSVDFSKRKDDFRGLQLIFLYSR